MPFSASAIPEYPDAHSPGNLFIFQSLPYQTALHLQSTAWGGCKCMQVRHSNIQLQFHEMPPHGMPEASPKQLPVLSRRVERP